MLEIKVKVKADAKINVPSKLSTLDEWNTKYKVNRLQKYLLDHPLSFANCKIKLQTPWQGVTSGFCWFMHPSGAVRTSLTPPAPHQSCHAPELLLLDWSHLIGPVSSRKLLQYLLKFPKAADRWHCSLALFFYYSFVFSDRIQLYLETILG